jgi:hypothetical protein
MENITLNIMTYATLKMKPINAAPMRLSRGTRDGIVADPEKQGRVVVIQALECAQPI